MNYCYHLFDRAIQCHHPEEPLPASSLEEAFVECAELYATYEGGRPTLIVMTNDGQWVFEGHYNPDTHAVEWTMEQDYA